MKDEKQYLVVRIMAPRCTFEEALAYLEHNDQVDGLGMLKDPTLLEPELSTLRILVREAYELAHPGSAVRLGDQMRRWGEWMSQAEAALGPLLNRGPLKNESGV